VWLPEGSQLSSVSPEAPAEGADRLAHAVAAAKAELAQVVAEARSKLGAEHAAIFEVQAALLDDPEWLGPVRDQVEQGSSPTDAVAKTTDELASDIAAIPDEYLQQRAADIRDLGQRVLRLLGGGGGISLADRLGSRPVVLAAHDLTPSETVFLDPAVVKGIVTEVGGRTAHTAIIARQLAIPAVVGIPGLLRAARDGALVAVDGDAGVCEVDPTEDLARAYSSDVVLSDEVFLPDLVTTRDDVTVHVFGNAATPDDVRRAIAAGADGIGLYRTEFAFVGDVLPDEDAQERIYSEAAEAAQGRPIIFRTLDVGGDKDVPLLGLEQEQNPFLGIRGVRFSLARPDLLAAQLRALGRTAARYPNVRVMVPMVTVLDELDQVRALVPDANYELGAMVEVPAAAILAAEIAAAADFLSVGTNDLTQYVLAVDRTSERVATLYDELNPAVLRLLHGIATAARQAGTDVGVCGDVASRPNAVPLLLGLGFRHLSVVPPQVQNVKRTVAATTLSAGEDLAVRALLAARPAEVARLLQDA
jgi:phosphoenolpyruvate-protein phosphotransferase